MRLRLTPAADRARSSERPVFFIEGPLPGFARVPLAIRLLAVNLTGVIPKSRAFSSGTRDLPWHTADEV